MSLLDASNLTYSFEDFRIRNENNINTRVIEKFREKNNNERYPENLEYLDDMYDATTSTSGTAFRDKYIGKVKK